MAGSSVTMSWGKISSVDPYPEPKNAVSVIAVTILWVADDTDGSVPETDFDTEIMEQIRRRYCCAPAITLPGNHAKCAGTAPTALYDIEILDEYDIDVFGGNLNNRSATESEQQVPKVGDGLSSRLVAGQWTFKLSGNSVNDANGKVVLYFEL